MIEFKLEKAAITAVLIIFGFYGWGTSTFGFMVSTRGILQTLAISFACFLLYRFADPEHTIEINRKKFLTRNLTFISILAVLVVLNIPKISDSLSGDELAYAGQAHIHSIQITQILIQHFAGAGDIQVRYIIQILSAMIFLGVSAFIYLLSRIKRQKVFYIGIFLTIITLRIAITNFGGSDSPNPPAASVIYGLGTTILGLTNPAYRLMTLCISAAFLTCIYELLSLRGLTKVVSLLCVTTIAAIPLVRQMSTVIEISDWTFYVFTYVLLRLYLKIETNQVFLLWLAALSYFRFPITVVFCSLILSELAQAGKIQSVKKYIPSFALILPLVVVFLSNRGGDSLRNFRLEDSGQIKFSYYWVYLTNQFHTWNLSLGITALCIGALGLLAFLLSSRKNLIFGATSCVGFFTIFLIGNSGPLSLSSKYVVEWLAPWVAFFILYLTIRLRALNPKKLGHLMTIGILFIILLLNNSHYNKYPEVFKSESSFNDYGLVKNIESTYFVIPNNPFNYKSAMRYLAENELISKCLNTGVVYGELTQVFAGINAKDYRDLISMRQDYNLSQTLSDESFATSSLNTLTQSNVECVILGFVYNKEMIKNSLEAADWEIVYSTGQNSYGNSVEILTREN